VVLVGAVSCRYEWPGIDDEHLVAPETLSQDVVGILSAAT
jgi:hypothetical protein